MFMDGRGMGLYKPLAIQLLHQVIGILDEFELPYFLISGTLLGHVRHKAQFIPWDDDIDLMVHEDLYNKLPAIYEKYKDLFVFIHNRQVEITKICYKIDHCITESELAPFLIPLKPEANIIKSNWNIQKGKELPNKAGYTFPFVDLFVYHEIPQDPNQIHFFGKEWDKKQFFPLTKTIFEGIPNVNIPCHPLYFLYKNFGTNCLTTLKSNSYCHKIEYEFPKELVFTISMDQYLHFKEYEKTNKEKNK
jgi:hypothetical protein